MNDDWDKGMYLMRYIRSFYSVGYNYDRAGRFVDEYNADVKAKRKARKEGATYDSQLTGKACPHCGKGGE